MIAGCFALAHFAAFPQVGTIWRKYVHLQEHPNQYSILYIGSSRVFHEFLPAQFDAALAKRGRHETSFNFGQDGMWPPESLYMIRHLLALNSKKLRWVFIDLMPVKPFIEGSETTLRAMYWHDWRHTLMALRYCLNLPDSDRPAGTRLNNCYTHLFLWAERGLNAGVGSQRLLLAMKMEKEKRAEEVEYAGWEAGPDRHLSEQELKDFHAETARLPQIPKHPIDPLLRDGLNDIIKEVRKAGAEPIFVVAAGFYGNARFSDWPPPDVKILAFDDPVRYPDLYNPDHRFDMFHLSLPGAQDFTRHLADRFAEYLEEKR